MNIVIIGNGISGTTAARFIRKLSNHKITIISNETEYFYSRTALMYVFMGHMRFEDIKPYENWFWSKNRINLIKAFVKNIDFKNKSLHLDNGDDITYDKLIISTGSASNKFGWPGQDMVNVHGLYHLQDLEAMEKYSKNLNRAVIVGGGLIGIEMAEMFHSRQIPVTMLVREKQYWDIVLPLEEAKMIGRHIIENGIDLRLETELREILDDGTGHANAVITNKNEKIECGFVGLTAGVHPNIEFLKGSELEINKGVVVNKYLETNIEDVYAIGDCAFQSEPMPGRRPIEAIWYTGRMMGETAAHNICGNRIAYDPGIWFNSAKFFEIEYQVYGEVPAVNPDYIQSIYWEHKGGKKSIRLNYHKIDGNILGFNLMGIRYRHEVCEKWIANKTPIEEVLVNLGMANFDPEFFKQYEIELIKTYNNHTGKNLILKQKRSFSSAFNLLKR